MIIYDRLFMFIKHSIHLADKADTHHFSKIDL